MPVVTESDGGTLLFERLRRETRDLHQQMEQQLPIFLPQFTLEGYRELLMRYEGFYAPVEEKLVALRDYGLQVFDETRRKHSLLRLDLERLRPERLDDPSPMNSTPRCALVPRLESVSQGIGCMYVLEGSTLGGQIISRHLKQALGVTPGNGGAFFASYGADLGRRWKEFRDIVAADERARSEANEIVASARETFLCFHNWLAA